ncbi:hypothetical protein PMAYCL1PPCAC_33263, partial [Pristionchus mayeri]
PGCSWIMWTSFTNKHGYWEIDECAATSVGGTIWILCEAEVSTTPESANISISTTETSSSYTPSAPAKPLAVASAIIAGQYCIKSRFDSYISVSKGPLNDWLIIFAPQCKECERWYIEDHHGKVAFKSYCFGNYLSARIDKLLNLEETPTKSMLWTP